MTIKKIGYELETPVGETDTTQQVPQLKLNNPQNMIVPTLPQKSRKNARQNGRFLCLISS